MSPTKSLPRNILFPPKATAALLSNFTFSVFKTNFQKWKTESIFSVYFSVFQYFSIFFSIFQYHSGMPLFPISALIVTLYLLSAAIFFSIFQYDSVFCSIFQYRLEICRLCKLFFQNFFFFSRIQRISYSKIWIQMSGCAWSVKRV